jgi:hypothetical protein
VALVVVQFAQKQLQPLVIPKPGVSARNLLAAGGETADSSRDNAALRNDNYFGDFQIATRRVAAVDGERSTRAQL